MVQSSTLLSVIGNGANKMSEIAALVGKEASSLTGSLAKLPFINKYDTVCYVLFLKQTPTNKASCLQLFPEDVIQLC